MAFQHGKGILATLKLLGNFVLVFNPIAFSAEAQITLLLIVFNYLFLFPYCVISHLRI